MSNRKITVTIGSLEEMGKEFIDAWHQIESGQKTKSTSIENASLEEDCLIQKEDSNIDYRDIPATDAKFWQGAEVVMPKCESDEEEKLEKLSGKSRIALANLALEGMKPTAEFFNDIVLYDEGKITLDELLARGLTIQTRIIKGAIKS